MGKERVFLGCTGTDQFPVGKLRVRSVYFQDSVPDAAEGKFFGEACTLRMFRKRNADQAAALRRDHDRIHRGAGIYLDQQSRQIAQDPVYVAVCHSYSYFLNHVRGVLETSRYA